MMKDEYYCTYDWSDEHNQYIAVISKGSPQRGDKNVVVCDVELFDHVTEIPAWFEKMMREKPWQPN